MCEIGRKHRENSKIAPNNVTQTFCMKGKRAQPVLVILVHPKADYTENNILLRPMKQQKSSITSNSQKNSPSYGSKFRSRSIGAHLESVNGKMKFLRGELFHFFKMCIKRVYL